MVNRCWFYPHFLPGVVYDSLGWTTSIVDVDGRERFRNYFGKDNFLSLEWAEDFFGEDDFGLERFVRRSVLLDDPDEFLPGDVLTVRCEVFYECHTGDAVFKSQEVEINGFLVKAFTIYPVIVNQLSSENRNENQCPPSSTDCRSNPLDERSTEVGVTSKTRPPVFYDPEHWRRTLRMMLESFSELDGAFELYRKLQQLKDIMEQSPVPRDDDGDSRTCPQATNKVDEDFSQDIEKAKVIFMALYETVKSDKEIQKDENKHNPEGLSEDTSQSDSDWWEESNGVIKISLQLARLLALHKHLQTRFENRKSWYKEFEKNRRVKEQPDQEDSSRQAIKNDVMENEIRELFVLFGKVREVYERAQSGDHTSDDEKNSEVGFLLCFVCRFLTVFLNTFRVLAVRLYWPICALQDAPSSLPQPSSTPETKDIFRETDRIGTVQQVLSKDDEAIQNENITSVNSSNPLPDPSWAVEMKRAIDETDTLVNAEGANGKYDNTNLKWSFTIETADGNQLDIPFQEGEITVGSLLRAASPVFDRMLKTPMLERTEKRLKLVDVDYSTLCHFVTYIQTGELTVRTLDECCLLYTMAHKYQVQTLMLACVERMGKLMDHRDVQDIEFFSRFFDDDTLLSFKEAYCFRQRTTMAVLGLQEYSPPSSQSTWSQAISDVPVVEMATEAVIPKEKYDFYH